MKTLKTKITKLFKQHSFPKVTILKSGRVKGYHTVLYPAYQYTGDEIRWSNVRGNPDHGEKQILAMMELLKKEGFSDYIVLEYVGLANMPVITLKTK